jgi:hypothetical protein
MNDLQDEEEYNELKGEDENEVEGEDGDQEEVGFQQEVSGGAPVPPCRRWPAAGLPGSPGVPSPPGLTC